MMMKVLGGVVCALSCCALIGAEFSADVVIYGSTPAALSAAVQTTRMGKVCSFFAPGCGAGFEVRDLNAPRR